MPTTWTTENDQRGNRIWFAKSKSGLSGLKVSLSLDFVNHYQCGIDVWNVEFMDWAGRIFRKAQDYSGLVIARKNAAATMHKLERIFDVFKKLDRGEQEAAVYEFAQDDEKGTLDGEPALRLYHHRDVRLPGNPVGQILRMSEIEGSILWKRYLNHECERLKLPGWKV